MKSWEATRWVRHLLAAPGGEPITRSEKLLLYTLADCHNEAMGDCACPALPTLAAEACFSRSQTLRLLCALERKQLVRIERRHGRANRYFLRVECGSGAVQAVDNSVQPVDGRCHYDTSNDTSEVSFRNGGGVTAMEPPRCHSSDTQSEYLDKKRRGESTNGTPYFNGRTRRWPPEDLWIKRFIDSPDCFFIPMGALDDPPWWDAVSRVCGGVNEKFVKQAFANMKCWMMEHSYRPNNDADWKTFARRWLVEENKREQHGARRRA